MAPRWTSHRCPATSLSWLDVELPHGGVDAFGDDRLDRVGGFRHDGVEQVALGRGYTIEDVVGAAILVGRFADPDADAEIVLCLEVLGDAPQPVVPRQPAAGLQLEHSRLEVELVVHDDDLPWLVDLVTPHQRRDRLARVVHERDREGQHDPLRIDARTETGFADEGVVTSGFQRRAVALGEQAHALLADVVTGAGVLLARVAESDHEPIERSAATGTPIEQAHVSGAAGDHSPVAASESPPAAAPSAPSAPSWPS